MGWNAWVVKEVSARAFRIPLYPFKLLIPVFAFLFLVQGSLFLSKARIDLLLKSLFMSGY